MNSDDAMATIGRFVAGDEAAIVAARDLFRRAWLTWLRAEGDLPLERVLGIDRRSLNQLQRNLRDFWLGQAHALCAGSTRWKRSVSLADEVRFFQASIWPAWRDLAGPPDGASELRSALFEAFRAADKIHAEKPGLKMPATPRGFHSIVVDCRETDSPGFFTGVPGK